MSRRGYLQVAMVIAIAAGTLLGLLFLAGVPPLVAIEQLTRGSVGSSGAWVATLRTFVPLALCALGIATAFQSGLWNIGAEGQLIVGAVVATAASQLVEHWLIALAAGAAAGAVLAALVAVLKTWRRVPEVLATIMLNFVAIEFLRYAVTGPLQEPSGQFPQSATLAVGCELPAITLSRTGTVHLGVLLVLGFALVLRPVLSHSRLGLLIRATASSPRAVTSGGFSVARVRITAFTLSGALAGLAGAVNVTGVTHVLDLSIASGTGYAAIAVALLAGLKPLLVVPSALLFAALATGTTSLQWAADVPGIDRFALVAQGLSILAVLWYLHLRRRHPSGRLAVVADERENDDG